MENLSNFSKIPPSLLSPWFRNTSYILLRLFVIHLFQCCSLQSCAIEITLVKRHQAAFWEEQGQNSTEGWGWITGAEQSGCGSTRRLPITLFFPRTQENEGFPVQAEPFAAAASLWRGVSVTCQAADSGLSTNSSSKAELAAAVLPSVPWDTANQLGGPVCPRACLGAEGVHCVKWGIAALSPPSGDGTNQTGPHYSFSHLSSPTAAST